MKRFHAGVPNLVPQCVPNELLRMERDARVEPTLKDEDACHMSNLQGKRRSNLRQHRVPLKSRIISVCQIIRFIVYSRMRASTLGHNKVEEVLTCGYSYRLG